MIDPRFAALFEPVRVGPVVAPNRFYQVPHCSGMGFGLPQTLMAMREIKAEGGWGVVNTEYCSIDPSSDDLPAPFASLWDDDDLRNLAAMAEAVHRHGSLAGVELWHGGMRSSNLHTRTAPLGPQSLPAASDPWQCARMDAEDIRSLRRLHRNAARRARAAGFNIIYVYAAHTYLLAQFLDPVVNSRNDDYGGPLANRARLLREILADTRDAVGDRCALALRIEVDDEDGGGGEERSALLASLAPMVDLFDVTVSDYSREMGSSRFVKEGALEPDIAHIRKLTGKPVVCVGRFTSPETMVSQVKRGIVDFVGAARPSIADPFLPTKIREGRPEDIRECIGCNICYACDGRGVPIRCTQNPSMGEEWRRAWHPERMPAASRRRSILVVGGGPAGLEAAMSLGRRGHEVKLAEASRSWGGRLLWESRLPGLAEWIRVRDWRVHQLSKLPNVEMFPGSAMTADDAAAVGADHIVLATGSRWRTDGRGRTSRTALAMAEGRIAAPEEVIGGAGNRGAAVVFDDDHYYVASAVAELLAGRGMTVTYVTSEGKVSAWSEFTGEQFRIHARLLECGVRVAVNMKIDAVKRDHVVARCLFSNREIAFDCGIFVPVTSREPDETLWRHLVEMPDMSVTRIGDCRAPGLVAHAVYDGHRFARELGEEPAGHVVRRERPVIGA